MQKVKVKIEKTNIGALVEVDVWREFQKYCIDVGRRPGDMLTEVMGKHVKQHEKKRKAVAKKHD